uniref:PDZ domain-containing protein n=1 Tax=Cuerna arida TaxID=1464854 RepID=A0A1B6H1L5_9HEMI
MSNGSISTSNTIRLCHIIKWEDFDGYGFNLHAEKGKPGQYIGKVDEDSPAEAAGLKEGDRIIEVNGVNIANENHKQVVQRIKALPEETKLLVVDSEADNYFKLKNVVIKNTNPNVVYLKTPIPRPSSGLVNGKEIEDNQSQKSGKSGLSAENEGNGEKTWYKGNSASTTPSSERKRSLGSSPEPQSDQGPDGGSWVPNMNNQNNTLNLNMTAKELRAQLAARKKYDPKKDALDFKKKYDIVQKL